MPTRMVKLKEGAGGYLWQYIGRDSDITVMKDQMLFDREEVNPVEHRFKFFAPSPGKRILKFIYHRPWEDSILETRLIEVDFS